MLENIAREIRQNIIQTSYEAHACHIGSSLSCVEILAVLYFKIFKKKDAFIFSKASGACALYNILAAKKVIPQNKVIGYLKKYPLASKEVQGVIWSAGSLGHGLPVATGLALADRKRKVYCLMSDGELNEGTTWESALFANHRNLNNLVVIVDRNRLQACGHTEKIARLESLQKKWEAFGWEAREINGHNFVEIEGILKKKNEKPLAIIANTVKGKGVDFMQENFKWHYENLTPDLYEKAFLQVSK